MANVKRSLAHRMTELGFLLALGVVLHWVETLFPPLLPLPGAKLGLANVVTLLLLLEGRPKETVVIGIMRIFLASLLGGNFLGVAFFMSLGGGMNSILGMFLVQRKTTNPLFVSVGGALFHNFGQWLVAWLWMQSTGLVFYLPLLIVFSLPSGLLVGYLGMLFMRHETRRYWRCSP